MSKKNKVIMLSVIIFLICALFISLIIVDSLKRKEPFLAINQGKIQIYYEIGEEFNKESLDVYYENSEGHVNKIEDYDLDLSAFNSSKEGVYEIKLKYQDSSLTFNVFVYNKDSFKEIFYNGLVNFTNSILVKENDNTLYLNEDGGYIEYKNNDIYNKIFYTDDIYRVYDCLTNEYTTDRKMTKEQFWETLNSDQVYDSNLNLAQNFVDGIYNSIFSDNNYIVNFKDGVYLFENTNSDYKILFNNYGYLEKLTNLSETLNFQQNAYFDFPNLP